MRRTSFLFLCVVAVAALARNVHAGDPASIVIDGTVDAAYGAALSVQNTNTQFGNADTGDPINGGSGSEIDQVFATVLNGRLHVFVAGNLETNFNKLDVFIDSVAGGVNTIDGPNLPVDVDRFCCGGEGSAGNALQNMNGLTFDADFNADYMLTFTHGFEKLRPDLSDQLEFYAFTSHYADLTQGTAGTTGSLGMQLAHRGLPNVLRGTTADVNVNGKVDGADFLTWQRGVNQFNGTTTFATRLDGDASSDQVVDGVDRGILEAEFGFDVAEATFDENFFAPLNGSIDNSNILLGPQLPGLSQGELIDKNYSLAPGPGGGTDNEGAGLITRELEFTLPIADSDPTNTFSHRNMENIVDLRMAMDNSNTEGVSGDSPYTTPTSGNPGDVSTGLEFSIPLEHIGNPTSGSTIRIFAFVNNGDHNFASNQFSGEGILDANLGGNGFGGFTGDLSGVDMTDFADDQFITVPGPVGLAAGVVPEPTAALLTLVAGLGLGLGIRRR